ncbi:hypothetical protein Tco_0970702 [Tanacetum coccineum]
MVSSRSLLGSARLPSSTESSRIESISLVGSLLRKYSISLRSDSISKGRSSFPGGNVIRASSSANSSSVSEDASSPAQEAIPAPDTQPLDADADADEIPSDGHGFRKLYKDPKVCRTALDRFPTLAETYRLRELSLVELSDRISMLQCQLITHGSMLNARYDHSLSNFERLSKQCAQQTQTIKKQRADLKQQSESTVRANEEVSSIGMKRDDLALKKEKIKEELVGTKSQLEHRERQAEEIQDNIVSFFQSDFTPLVRKFLKSGEFNQAFAGVLNTTISVGVERGLRMDRTDEEFTGLSQKVAGFIPDAKEKFDRVIAAFPDTIFPFLDKANTHMRHSTSSSGTFGHTSTPEHLKKKKKSVEKGGPSAA